ncbi:MAG: NADPH-dependent 7-cyano-7-deazaguanine reductase QueF [Pseudomonadales bacterium]|nr:NADPH-dependent 7-cyano-7-deazaguanine reductase QueF [Pseudomonadales bacterium]
MADNPLGESIPSPSKYDPGILYPIPRWPARSLLDIDKKIPMHGFDHWHAYELSWLNQKGKPLVAVAEFFFNADSENIVESKSLKLYLNSFNQEKFEDSQKVSSIISNDLSALSKSEVKVVVSGAEDPQFGTHSLGQSKSIDSHDVEMTDYEVNAELLTTTDELVFDEDVVTMLFRSNCPVTGAPDWASVQIVYTGQKVDERALLKYLCSYRQHQAYHEECAERIYRDLMVQCQPQELRVGMNFLRRGGLDINVYRSSAPINSDQAAARYIRQ